MEIFKGIAASPGIQTGEAVCIYPVSAEIDAALINEERAEEETALFQKAVRDVKERLGLAIADARGRKGAETAEILEAHVSILEDEEFINEVIAKIRQERHCAAYAVDTVTQKYFQEFSALGDPVFRERGADIKDLGSRIILSILGKNRQLFIPSAGEGLIALAHEFTPSDLVECAAAKVSAIVAETGTLTAHTAIMANNLRITAVLGASGIMGAFVNGDRVIVDGEEGLVIRNPDEATEQKYREKRASYLRYLEDLKTLRDLPAVTNDGSRTVRLAANISSAGNCAEAIDSGAEGVGVFRTEFYFVECGAPPGEEEQFQIYRETAQKFAPHSVVIRTLDIGGDKNIPYIAIPPEMNPFMGWRGIRLCLEMRDLFKCQLRAMLRASAYGNVHIMYPMISDLRDLNAANAVLYQAKAELEEEGASFNAQVPVGVMIEVPSAAILADQLVQKVDFFSIGTNDLTQYTLAVDRNNEKIALRYDPMHTAVLRLIKHVAETAHRHGKWVGVCGEMAGDKNAAAVLVGLGIDELSMNIANILPVKHAIRNMSVADALAAAENAIQRLS